VSPLKSDRLDQVDLGVQVATTVGRTSASLGPMAGVGISCHAPRPLPGT
jgi:hypothetical protein